MTYLAAISFWLNIVAACYILRLQHRVKVVANGRLEATEARYRALRDAVNLAFDNAALVDQNTDLLRQLNTTSFLLRATTTENTVLKHHLSPPCSCGIHRFPPVDQN